MIRTFVAFVALISCFLRPFLGPVVAAEIKALISTAM